MKYNCELVQDLLPMYHDQALSKTSSDIVEEHIKSCSECRELSETLQAEQSTGEKSAEKVQEEVTSNSGSAVGLFSKRVRRVRKIVISIFVVLVLLLSVSIGYIRHMTAAETPSYTFISYLDAQDIVTRGWIPENLPEDTTNIYVTYNLDNNVVNGSFNLTQSGVVAFTERTTTAMAKDFNNLPKAIDPEWDVYREMIYNQKAQGRQYQLLQSQEYVFALSDTGHVLFWSK